MKREMEKSTSIKVVAVKNLIQLKTVLDIMGNKELNIYKIINGFVIEHAGRWEHWHEKETRIMSLRQVGITCFGDIPRNSNTIYATGTAQKYLKILGFKNKQDVECFAYIQNGELHIEEMQEVAKLLVYESFTSELPCKIYSLDKIADIKWNNFCKAFNLK